MSGPTWSLWAVPIVAFACVAVLISSVYIADRAERLGQARQSAADQRQSVPDEELPPRNADRERRIA
jgi:cytochrome c-type biogenesis protein CcmH/NrfF